VRIFLSYASEHREIAERINYALIAHGHDVFFDRADLVAGREFDAAIARAIDASDLFIFLVAPESIEQGRYTLSELQMAARRWPNPSAAVLPVVVRRTDRAAIPAYLRAVSLLQPEGEIGAEVAAAVEQLARATRATRRLRLSIAIAALVAVGALAVAGWKVWKPSGAVPAQPDASPAAAAIDTTLPPAAIRRRTRAVAGADGGYLLALAAPPELRWMSDDHRQIGDPVPLPGEPIEILELSTEYLITTRRESVVLVLNRKDGSKVESIPVVPPPQVSSTIRTLAVQRNELFASVAGPDGATALIKRRFVGDWYVPSWMAGDYAKGDQPPWNRPAPMRLRVINGTLWALSAAGPTELFRIMGPARVDAVVGGQAEPIACASDFIQGADGRMLLLSCRNELLQIFADGITLQVERTGPAVPLESSERRASELLVSGGRAVFVAMSTSDANTGRPRRVRVSRLDASGAVELGQASDAVAVSLAVSPQLALAVIKRVDDTFDCLALPRHKER
jgi:hypothetical protein